MKRALPAAMILCERICDWYIELCKPLIFDNSRQKQNTLSVLLYAFKTILKVMHPFMPFITEEIWQALPNASESIMTEKYPTKSAGFKRTAEARAFEDIKDIIKAIRNKRAEMNVPPSRNFGIYKQRNPVSGKERNIYSKLKCSGRHICDGATQREMRENRVALG